MRRIRLIAMLMVPLLLVGCASIEKTHERRTAFLEHIVQTIEHNARAGHAVLIDETYSGSFYYYTPYSQVVAFMKSRYPHVTEVGEHLALREVDHKGNVLAHTNSYTLIIGNGAVVTFEYYRDSSVRKLHVTGTSHYRNGLFAKVLAPSHHQHNQRLRKEYQHQQQERAKQHHNAMKKRQWAAEKREQEIAKERQARKRVEQQRKAEQERNRDSGNNGRSYSWGNKDDDKRAEQWHNRNDNGQAQEWGNPTQRSKSNNGNNEAESNRPSDSSASKGNGSSSSNNSDKGQGRTDSNAGKRDNDEAKDNGKGRGKS